MTRRGKPRTVQPARAPGNLETVRRFLNSGVGKERLATAAALESWLTARRLPAAAPGLSEEDRLRVVEMREGLRAVAARPSAADESAAATNRLAAALGELRYRLRLDDRGFPRFDPAGEGLAAVFGALMGIVARSRTAWRRVKICPACERAFYDRSRSRVAKWCSDRCGDRIRARTRRRRKKYSGSRR